MSTVHTGDPTAPLGSSDRPLAAGDVVGEYVIEGELGKGGFGTVYRAAHPLIGKQVAIKVLARRYSADEAMVSRFVAEARAVNQIRHRNIIDIFSFGQLTDGRHYYVMEMLDGEPLDHYLERKGSLAPDEALPILRSIAKALDAAHAKGIAHRDLKPENIFLAHDGEGDVFPKLLDFGIAKLLAPDDLEAAAKHKTATGAPIGTPYYMSPEQCRGKDVDHRTDIYSFGILAYRLLTGAYPFDGEGYLDLMMQQINEEPLPPSAKNPALPPRIDAAIAHMMQKDPALRPPTVSAGVAEMADGTLTPSMAPMTPSALPRTARASHAAFAPTMAPVTGAPPAPRSRASLWVALAAVAIVGAGTGVYFATRSPPATPAPPLRSPVAHVEPPPADAAIATAPAADAPVAPKHVILTLTGAPDGTEVKIGATTVGVTPTVQLDLGDRPVVLTFVADGYLPASLEVTPDRDLAKKITLKKRRTGQAPKQPGRDDIIHDVPGLIE